MGRIKGRLSGVEFENICRNKEITCPIEISQRYQNYLIGYNGLNDDKSSSEVGANIKEEDLDED